MTIFSQLGRDYTSIVGGLADGVYVDSFLYNGGPKFKEFVTEMKKKNPKLVDSFRAQQGWTLAAVTVAAIKERAKTGEPLYEDGYLKTLVAMHGVPAGLLPSATFDGVTCAAANKAAMFRYDGIDAKRVTDFVPLPKG